MTEPPVKAPSINYSILRKLMVGEESSENLLKITGSRKKIVDGLMSLRDGNFIESRVGKDPIYVIWSITEGGKGEFKERVLESFPHAGNYLGDLKLVSPEYFKKLNELILGEKS